MFGFIKTLFIRLSTRLFRASSRTKCLSKMCNQKCITQLFITNLHSNKYTQGLHCDLFAVNLDRLVGSYNRKCRCECKNQKHCVYEKDCIWNPATCSCKNGRYLASIMNDSVITCDEIIEEPKTVPTNFNEKNATCKTKKAIFYVPFY